MSALAWLYTAGLLPQLASVLVGAVVLGVVVVMTRAPRDGGATLVSPARHRDRGAALRDAAASRPTLRRQAPARGRGPPGAGGDRMIALVELCAVAVSALALAVAVVTLILYLVVRGNWRARVIAAVMTAQLAVLVLWVVAR
jgi:hypothetical protein